jgi:hypothetical protein
MNLEVLATEFAVTCITCRSWPSVQPQDSNANHEMGFNDSIACRHYKSVGANWMLPVSSVLYCVQVSITNRSSHNIWLKHRNMPTRHWTFILNIFGSIMTQHGLLETDTQWRLTSKSNQVSRSVCRLLLVWLTLRPWRRTAWFFETPMDVYRTTRRYTTDDSTLLLTHSFSSPRRIWILPTPFTTTDVL